MFKKPFDVGVSTRTTLKNKDLRGLRTQLTTAMGISEDDLSQLFPTKASVEMIKFSSRTVAYRVVGADSPLVLDLGGRSQFVPTLAALWILPDLLTPLYINSATSEFILRGADLMLPGVIVPRTGLNFQEGQIVSIVVRGNPLPFAIGETTISSHAALSSGMQGRGVKILHVFGDELWRFGIMGTPNAGFTSVRVSGIASAPTAEEAQAEVEVKADDAVNVPLVPLVVPVPRAPSDNTGWDGAPESGPAAAAAAAEPAPQFKLIIRDGGSGGGAWDVAPLIGTGASADAGVEIEDESSESSGSGSDSGSDSDSDSGSASESESGSDADAGDADGDEDVGEETKSSAQTAPKASSDSKQSVEEADELMKGCLIQALKLKVKDTDLPIHATVLYSDAMRAVRPPKTTLDVKQSSYKNLKKFLMAMRKIGLIALKEVKGVMVITGIDRTCPEYVHFAGWAMAKTKKLKSAAVPTRDPDVFVFPTLSELCKPYTSLQPVVEVVAAREPSWEATGVAVLNKRRSHKTSAGHRLYSKKDIAGMVIQYVAWMRLTHPEAPQMVVLDQMMMDAMYKGQRKVSGAVDANVVTKETLVRTIVDRCQRFHALKFPDEAEPRIVKGALIPLEISVKNVQGNKKITTLRNVEVFGLDPESVRRKCAKQFAASATIHEAADTKEHQADIVIQGDVSKQLRNFLLQDCALPPKYIK